MPESKEHKRVAKRIAKKKGVSYNDYAGVDIKARNEAIEVKTPGNVARAKQQLNPFSKRVYIAGTNQKAVNEALEETKGTSIGVMDAHGNIKRSSSR